MPRSSPDVNHTAVVEHYAKLAPKYDKRWDRYSRATLDAALRQIDLDTTDSLLDVACGTGRFAEMIRTLKPSLAITGIDLSPDMIAVAKERIPPGDGVAWHVGPAETLPVEDNAYDVVTCANAFHLVTDPEKSMAELYRVVKPGGSLVLVDWCREYITVHGVLVASRLFGKQYRRIRTREKLKEVVERSGFDVKHIEKFKATWFWGLTCLRAEKPA